MRKYTVLMMACLAPVFALACDICGCGVGNTYVGILPEFHKHIVGIRYRYSSLVSHVGVGGATSYLTTDEYYKTTELWGGFNIGKKLRLLASVPYNFNERCNQGNSVYKNGLGDITALAYYQLLNKRSTIKNKVLINTLWIGGGVKMPTGQYNPLDKGSTNANNNLFQLGTGSVDFLVNTMYDIRFQDAGINVNANYKMNTRNGHGYQYGNKATVSGQLYHKFKIANKFSVVPNAGLLYENARQDKDNGTTVDISGGNLTMGSLGLETAYKKIAFGINWQSPLQQNLANGIVKANDRVMLHVSFML